MPWRLSRRSAATGPPTYRSTTSPATAGSAAAASSWATHRAFVGTGIFAAELVGPARERGLLADAVVVRRSRVKNFLRRLARDLREHRKPPLTLVRRGLRLLRAEPGVVARQIELGCRPCDRAGTLAALRSADA